MVRCANTKGKSIVGKWETTVKHRTRNVVNQTIFNDVAIGFGRSGPADGGGGDADIRQLVHGRSIAAVHAVSSFKFT